MKLKLKKKVIEVISLIMDVNSEELNQNSTVDTISSWDSLNHMNLIIALEDEFGIKFSDEEIFSIDSISTILKILELKL